MPEFTEKKVVNDVFANIAAQRIQYRDKTLIEPVPPTLPEKILPFGNDKTAIFSPKTKIDSAEKLNEELKKFREKFKPFIKNLAPEIRQTRINQELKEFNWRVETSEDKQDFQKVHAGLGDWKVVHIPHYGEPLGKAVTYYRTITKITKQQLEKGAAFIHFKGVDYKAHVFINSCYLGSHEGFFAPFEFDFTDCAKIGDNVILIKVENDFIMGGNTGWGQADHGDKIYAATGLGYDEPIYGWHHCPPAMGIYQDVSIEFRPRIFISDISVRPLPQSNSAEAWIEIYSCDVGQKQISLNLSLYGQNFEQTVFENIKYSPTSISVNGLNDDLNIALAKANGSYRKPVRLFMERGINYLKIPFKINDFRLWNNETPWLYQLQVSLLDEQDKLLDAQKRHLGMRSFRMDEESNPKGALYLNDNPIRLRGANTMGHEQMCVFRKDFDQLIDDILLAKICNMNFLRLTQRPVQPEVYDYCDMLGLMTQTDLPTFGCIRINQYNEALRQVGEMEKLVRSHPCNIMISYINEPFPHGKNLPHRNISRDEMEAFFRAAGDIVHHLNPDRVIKPCDGDYDPPAPGIQDRHCYPCWYNGQGVDIGMLIRGYWQPTKKDWYYGCGEFGSEALESQEVMRKYYPAHWLPQNKEDEKSWSPNSIVRAQTGMFHYFFYDTQDTLEEWIKTSQEHQKRSLKIMTESFRRKNDMITFAVHLFIDAWPSGWMKTIMDCERQPKKGYFAYRDALSPLLPSIRTDRTKFFECEKIRMEAWISNDLPKVPQGLSFHYQLECDGKVIFAQKTKAEIDICKSTFQGYIEFNTPEVIDRKSMTVRVAIIDSDGITVNDNYTDIEIFPQVNTFNESVCLIGNNGPARKLANELSLKTTNIAEDSNVMLISDFTEYKDNEALINQKVKNGARAVFLELAKEDKYEIAGSIVDVKTSRFNPLHFASRKTGHKLVDGFKEFDFNYWYEKESDMIKPIIESTFTCDDFEPVLTAGNADQNSNWTKVLAVGEKKYGKGSFIVCQIKLAGRTSTNPTAKIFALCMMDTKESICNKIRCQINS